eukprot:5596392-Alexandrium_andersonii.AAC.1
MLIAGLGCFPTAPTCILQCYATLGGFRRFQAHACQFRHRFCTCKRPSSAESRRRLLKRA